jgi:hypothetical protein
VRTQSDAAPTSADTGFVPIGLFARASDGGPGLRAEAVPAAIAKSPVRPVASARSEVDTRPGLIEIDLQSARTQVSDPTGQPSYELACGH